MKHIIFVEGVSGTGKSTTVRNLAQQLHDRGYKVHAHYEGDADSPLDLCWTAYLTPADYQAMLCQYPDLQAQLTGNTLYAGEYYLVRYRINRVPLYPDAVDAYLHSREFCYNPENVLPLSVFTGVFGALWKRYMCNHSGELDYEIFDASLVSHMTNDLVRNYHASPKELVHHLNTLLEIVKGNSPVVFYLYTDNVSKRVTEARISRCQKPLSRQQIQFWESRMSLDMQVLPDIQAEVYYMDVSRQNWDEIIPEILNKITTA